MRDTFNEILTTIRHNKLRTALTGFSVAWGIFILIVLLGAGNGLINAVTSNSKKFLANSMVIYGGETSKLTPVWEKAGLWNSTTRTWR